MSTLDEDIARIAALRGRSADTAGYQADAAYLARRIPKDSVAQIFKGNPDWRSDLEWFDHLPAPSRDFIRECVLQLNAGWWGETLRSGVKEDHLIGAVLTELPVRVHEFIMRHYGRDHPSARKLT